LTTTLTSLTRAVTVYDQTSTYYVGCVYHCGTTRITGIQTPRYMKAG